MKDDKERNQSENPFDEGVKKLNLEPFAELEQMESVLEAFAQLIGRYYQSLRDAGLPEEAALDLVSDWHVMFWSSQLQRRF